jgi:hypothetical protein
MITVKKTHKLFLKISVSYHNKLVRIRDKRWGKWILVSLGPGGWLETGGGHFEHYF